MSHMGTLASLPRTSDFEAAQSQRTLSYFLPINSTTHKSDNPETSSRILIHESPNLLAAGSNVGLRTWEACLHLAYYLCTSPTLEQKHHDKKSIQGSNIIELGAGTGLLSLICALSLGANHVLATDGLPHVVEGIGTNIEINHHNHSHLFHHQDSSFSSDRRLPITASVLDWTDLTYLDDTIQSDSIEYDYILGADITYHPELFDPLARTIRRLKDKYPKARVLVSATVRNENTLNQFRRVCEEDHGLSIKEIPESEWKCPQFKDQSGLFHEQAFPIIIMDIDFDLPT
jgi:predicted nicotinamide N-methyase